MRKLIAILAVVAIIFALAVPAFASTSSPTGTQTGTQGAGGAVKSPQTGYNTALWMIAAAVATLAAGYCFVRSRKVTE